MGESTGLLVARKPLIMRETGLTFCLSHRRARQGVRALGVRSTRDGATVARGSGFPHLAPRLARKQSSMRRICGSALERCPVRSSTLDTLEQEYPDGSVRDDADEGER